MQCFEHGKILLEHGLSTDEHGGFVLILGGEKC